MERHCQKSSKKRGLGSRGHHTSTRGADSFRGMSTNDPKGKKLYLYAHTCVCLPFPITENRFYYYTQCHVNVHVSDRFLSIYSITIHLEYLLLLLYFLYTVFIISRMFYSSTIGAKHSSCFNGQHNFWRLVFVASCARNDHLSANTAPDWLIMTTRSQNHKRNDSEQPSWSNEQVGINILAILKMAHFGPI
jgi:hypothetical protein